MLQLNNLVAGYARRALARLDSLKVEPGEAALLTGPSGAGKTILTRRSAGCPFCPPNEPTEAIQITTTMAVHYTQAPIMVEGKLHLVSHSKDGLFYRFDKARLD